MNSIFSGQYGSFGGGYLTGPTGQQTREMAFGGGGGPIGPMGQAPLIQEVPLAAGAVVYAESVSSGKPRQPGRQAPRYFQRGPFTFPVSPEAPEYWGGLQRQKRY